MVAETTTTLTKMKVQALRRSRLQHNQVTRRTYNKWTNIRKPTQYMHRKQMNKKIHFYCCGSGNSGGGGGQYSYTGWLGYTRTATRRTWRRRRGIILEGPTKVGSGWKSSPINHFWHFTITCPTSRPRQGPGSWQAHERPPTHTHHIHLQRPKHKPSHMPSDSASWNQSKHTHAPRNTKSEYTNQVWYVLLI